jgi:hypothetical protein
MSEQELEAMFAARQRNMIALLSAVRMARRSPVDRVPSAEAFFIPVGDLETVRKLAGDPYMAIALAGLALDLLEQLFADCEETVEEALQRTGLEFAVAESNVTEMKD